MNGPTLKEEEEDVLRLLERCGALQQGHFLLSSGLHSPQYVQCALLLQDPEATARVCAALVRPFRDSGVQVVAGPAIGAIPLVYEAARQLRARGIWTERVEGRMQLRRSFRVAPGERVLVVEDVVTTGGSAREVVELMRQLRADVVGVASLVDRTGGIDPGFGVPFTSLVRLELAAYDPVHCPLCQAGMPLHQPGSRSFTNSERSSA
jgi:orotate phosphoribosyltransferase